jgi:hypothetical protein
VALPRGRGEISFWRRTPSIRLTDFIQFALRFKPLRASRAGDINDPPSQEADAVVMSHMGYRRLPTVYSVGPLRPLPLGGGGLTGNDNRGSD